MGIKVKGYVRKDGTRVGPSVRVGNPARALKSQLKGGSSSSPGSGHHAGSPSLKVQANGRHVGDVPQTQVHVTESTKADFRDMTHYGAWDGWDTKALEDPAAMAKFLDRRQLDTTKASEMAQLMKEYNASLTIHPDVVPSRPKTSRAAKQRAWNAHYD